VWSLITNSEEFSRSEQNGKEITEELQTDFTAFSAFNGTFAIVTEEKFKTEIYVFITKALQISLPVIEILSLIP